MQPGEVLLDKYRVEEVLGTGGMGRVVRVAHLTLQQEFAIKILLPHMAESAETVSRFLREAQAAARLKSEHIARVTDTGTMTDGVPFMVMEYLAGNDLNQILRHHGPQRPQIVCDLMLQACEALAEAHSFGIIHRDIKPSNFFITTRPDGTMLLKILDFGISKTPVGITELTGASTVIGTPTYMSPEQMKSGKAADARSDIWSMGIVMYQLLNGRPPYVGESYAELVIKVGSEPTPPMHVQLPIGLSEVIGRCLDKNPEHRQQDVAELARVLAPYASDPVQGAQSATRTTRILQHKGAPALQVSPLMAGGGRLTPLTLSPPVAPRWAPNSSSLSQGRGQVTHTHQVRGGRRGLLVVGVLGLVAAAGAGGYIANSGGSSEPDITHVSAPPPKDDVKVEPTPPRPPEAKPAETKPTETKSETANTDSAIEIEPTKPEAPKTAKTSPNGKCTLSDRLPSGGWPDRCTSETKPVVTKTETPPVATKLETKPAAPTTTVVKTETKPTPTTAKTETKPATKPTTVVVKPATTVVKPTTTAVKTETKPATKPATKPKTKPKNDDLFDSRH